MPSGLIRCNVPLTNSPFEEIIWSSVNRWFSKIGPVHFMVGDNRFQTCHTPHVYPISLHPHISNYESIKIHFEAAINKEKIHLTNRKPCTPISKRNKWSEQNHPDLFDNIFAFIMPQKLNLSILACVRDLNLFKMLSLPLY